MDDLILSKPDHPEGVNPMNKKIRILLIISVLAVLLVPASTSASGLADDKVIFGGNYTLQEGDVLTGDLVAFGGNVEIEIGATVNGDVAVMGGNLTSAGIINGNLVGMGGFVTLQETARVNGDLTVLGSSLDQEPGARIDGNIITENSFPFEFTLPSSVTAFNGDFSDFSFWGAPFVSAGWFFFRLLIWAGLAVILMLFLEENALKVKKSAFEQPAITFLTGLGIALIAPVVLLILTITLLLIPVALIGVFLLIFAWMVGWVALGLEVGRRLSRALDQTWPAPVNAGIGMFLTFLLFNGFQQIVPCFGFLPKTIAGLWMLGAVLLTRFGTQDYPSTDVGTGTEQISGVFEPVETEATPGSEEETPQDSPEDNASPDAEQED
jgi:hypothetical protein